MVDTVRFPDIDLYKGWGAPMRAESQITDLEIVEGVVPIELDGVWFRAGPDRQYPPMTGQDIFVDGEGMVHRFAFSNGHIDYRSRWVHTDRYQLQASARRSLFGNYRNRHTNDALAQGVSMGTANTTPIWHAGKLLVFKEDDLGWELDPNTLETKGRYDYGGQIKSLTLSAHPKHDQRRDELLTFSYMANGDGTTDVVFYAINNQGKIVDQIPVQAPWPAMMHDFGVTEHHIIFLFGPVINDMEVAKRGGPFYQYHPGKEMRIAVLPRAGTEGEVRWFKTPHFTTSHTLNAFEQDGKVCIDLAYYEGNAFPFFPTPAGEFAPEVPPWLKRLSMDLTGTSDQCEVTSISKLPGELPQIDERFHTRRHRYGWRVSPSDPGGEASVLGPAMLVRDDFETGALDIWNPGPHAGLHEPQFIARRPDAAEGDGFIVIMVNRLHENRTDIAILDALNLQAGPIAVARMPVRVRMTFHGCWVPRETLASGRYALYQP